MYASPDAAVAEVVALLAGAMAPLVAHEPDAPPAGTVTTRPPYVAPSTRTEDVLASIWSELLEVDRVGAGDDFFALGGHSLIATRLASKVRELFGIEVPVRAVFDNPVLADLARVVGALADGGDAAEELAGTVAAVREMSDAEVQALLAELEEGGGRA